MATWGSKPRSGGAKKGHRGSFAVVLYVSGDREELLRNSQAVESDLPRKSPYKRKRFRTTRGGLVSSRSRVRESWCARRTGEWED